MTRPWEVRAANEGDLEFLQRMLHEAANRPGDDWPPFEECINEPRFRRFWVSWPRAGDIGVVAHDRGTPIGAAWIRRFAGDELSPIDDSEIPVLAIAVERDYRGVGVGHALLRELITGAIDAGYVAIDLTAGVFNRVALHLYATHGFEEVGRLAPRRPGGGEGVHMRVRLDSTRSEA